MPVKKAAGSAAPDIPPRPGAVILARHGEPALSRRVRLNAAAYRAWWAKYEAGGLAADQNPPPGLKAASDKAGFIIASTRPRSVETARTLSRGRAFAEDPIFIEAPLPPPHLPRWVKLSPRLWGFLARSRWWFLNGHDGEESRRQAHARAVEAARQLTDLAAGGQDVLVVAHGFFNHMIGRALRRQGWRCIDDQGFRYWSARRFERREEGK
jgi:broad specificity phosphatase PhoE